MIICLSLFFFKKKKDKTRINKFDKLKVLLIVMTRNFYQYWSIIF